MVFLPEVLPPPFYGFEELYSQTEREKISLEEAFPEGSREKQHWSQILGGFQTYPSEGEESNSFEKDQRVWVNLESGGFWANYKGEQDGLALVQADDWQYPGLVGFELVTTFIPGSEKLGKYTYQEIKYRDLVTAGIPDFIYSDRAPKSLYRPFIRTDWEDEPHSLREGETARLLRTDADDSNHEIVKLAALDWDAVWRVEYCSGRYSTAIVRQWLDDSGTRHEDFYEIENPIEEPDPLLPCAP